MEDLFDQEAIFERIRQEDREEGFKEGFKEGYKEGQIEGLADALRQIMKSCGCSLDQALSMLGISAANFSQYDKLLAFLKK